MYKIFDETIRHYKISASELSRRCEVSPGLISRFRAGKVGLTTEKLDNLLAAMDDIEPGSRRHFCTLLAGENPNELVNQLKLMNTTQLADLIRSAADCLAESSSNNLVGTLS